MEQKDFPNAAHSLQYRKMDGTGRLYGQAVTFARKGHYTRASNVLQQALKTGQCTPAEAYDLQARILAQQGLYLKAEFYWREARKLDPENPEYADALARLRHPRPSAFLVISSVAMLTLVAVLSLAILLTFIPWRNVSRQPSRLSGTATQDDTVRPEQNLYHGAGLNTNVTQSSIGQLENTFIRIRTELETAFDALDLLRRAESAHSSDMPEPNVPDDGTDDSDAAEDAPADVPGADNEEDGGGTGIRKQELSAEEELDNGLQHGPEEGAEHE